MPSNLLWYWDDSVQRYRGSDGRFVGVAQMQELREVFMKQQKLRLENLTLQYSNREIGFVEFQTASKLIIKDTYIDMCAMGAGGRNNLSHRDWGRIGAMVKEQYKYLRNMMGQIARGEITPRQAIARFAMYINSANEALWKALTRDLDFNLPAYPGDGSTQCLTNCKCEWRIEKLAWGVDAYWMLGEAEHCDDCVERSNTWNPWKWPEARRNE